MDIALAIMLLVIGGVVGGLVVGAWCVDTKPQSGIKLDHYGSAGDLAQRSERSR